MPSLILFSLGLGAFSVRARVLFSNGKRTFDYLWVRHDVSNVYWGWTGSSDKGSYHASGATHTVSLGVRSRHQMRSPLAQLKGRFHLTTLSFNNDARWFDIQTGRDYRGSKSDALLMIDSRAIPPGAHVSVSLGLLEPGRLDILQTVPSTPDQPTVEGIVGSTKLILVSKEFSHGCTRFCTGSDHAKRPNQAMQRTADRSAFPLQMTSTFNPQPHTPSPAVADLVSR